MIHFSEFLLPDEAIQGAIGQACEFFGLPGGHFREDNSVCVYPNNPYSYFDDEFGFNRDQIISLGLEYNDALTLAYSHECAHRMLQASHSLSPQQEELACDFLAGIQAGLNDIDPDRFASALERMGEDAEHPDGAIRAEAFRHAHDLASTMRADGHSLDFNTSMELFQDYLAGTDLDSAKHMAATPPQGSQPTFTAAYTPEQYLEKAENCYEEARKYYDKAAHAEKAFDREHYLREAKKWEARGDEYKSKAKYA